MNNISFFKIVISTIMTISMVLMAVVTATANPSATPKQQEELLFNQLKKMNQERLTQDSYEVFERKWNDDLHYSFDLSFDHFNELLKDAVNLGNFFDFIAKNNPQILKKIDLLNLLRTQSYTALSYVLDSHFKLDIHLNNNEPTLSSAIYPSDMKQLASLPANITYFKMDKLLQTINFDKHHPKNGTVLRLKRINGGINAEKETDHFIELLKKSKDNSIPYNKIIPIITASFNKKLIFYVLEQHPQKYSANKKNMIDLIDQCLNYSTDKKRKILAHEVLRSIFTKNLVYHWFDFKDLITKCKNLKKISRLEESLQLIINRFLTSHFDAHIFKTFNIFDHESPELILMTFNHVHASEPSGKAIRKKILYRPLLGHFMTIKTTNLNLADTDIETDPDTSILTSMIETITRERDHLRNYFTSGEWAYILKTISSDKVIAILPNLEDKDLFYYIEQLQKNRREDDVIGNRTLLYELLKKLNDKNIKTAEINKIVFEWTLSSFTANDKNIADRLFYLIFVQMEELISQSGYNHEKQESLLSSIRSRNWEKARLILNTDSLDQGLTLIEKYKRLFLKKRILEYSLKEGAMWEEKGRLNEAIFAYRRPRDEAGLTKANELSEKLETLMLKAGNDENLIYSSTVLDGENGARLATIKGTNLQVIIKQKDARKEALASFINDELGMDIVPKTILVGERSIQYYWKKSRPYEDGMEKKEPINKLQLQEMHLLDFLTYNSDRHFNNFLISTYKINQRDYGIIAIDHGMLWREDGLHADQIVGIINILSMIPRFSVYVNLLKLNFKELLKKAKQKKLVVGREEEKNINFFFKRRKQFLLRIDTLIWEEGSSFLWPGVFDCL